MPLLAKKKSAGVISSKALKVIKTAKALLAIHGKTTTLEVKIACRSLWPGHKFTQNYVSKTLQQTNIHYIDNGTFREYTTIAAELVPLPFTRAKAVTKTKLAGKVLNSDGEVFTACWVASDGVGRCYTAFLHDGYAKINAMGYIKIDTVDGNIKQIDPRTLTAVTINNTEYVKK